METKEMIYFIRMATVINLCIAVTVIIFFFAVLMKVNKKVNGIPNPGLIIDFIKLKFEELTKTIVAIKNEIHEKK